MSVVIIRPNGTGTITDANIVVGAPDVGEAKWEDIDEVVADDLTTYLRCGSGTEIQESFALEALGVSGTINSIMVYFRGANSTTTASPNTLRPGLYLAGVASTGTAINMTTDTWTTYAETVDKPGGGSWVDTDFADLEIIMNMASPNTGFSHITQTYLEIDYTGTGGGTTSNNAPFFGTNF